MCLLHHSLLKLQADGPCHAAAALALNGGMSQVMATQICNQTNKHLKMGQETLLCHQF